MIKLNLKEEESIAEEERKFPCIYDKGNEGYKEKEIWREIFSFKWNTEFIFYSKMWYLWNLARVHEIKNFGSLKRGFGGCDGLGGLSGFGGFGGFDGLGGFDRLGGFNGFGAFVF